MDYTTRLTIHSLELAVGPGEADSVRLKEPALVDVEYIFERGYAGLPTLPNGDPGEPGVPDEFDFKRIIAVKQLDLFSSDDKLKLEVREGSDIYPLLTLAELNALERKTVAALSGEADEARVETAIMHRELAVLLGGRP